jgi:peptide/nickel transport system permease protein
VIAHSVVHLAPGEPSEVDPSNPRLKPEDIARIRAAFHLDDPLHLQYVYWMRDLLGGELKSFKDNQPVLPKVWDRFLNSLPLFLCTTVVVWTLSFPTGIQAAIRRGSTYDRCTTFIAYALISIPGFFLSYLFILWVVGGLGAPVIGMRTFGMGEAGVLVATMDRLWHLFIPSLMSALAGVAILSRYVRSQMLEVIGQDYIRTARAKGLDEDTVVYRHALRNALLPFITMFGLLLPSLIGGSVIFEQIFAWPGIGRLGYDSILARDFPVILTLNFVAAALTLVGTFLSDLLYALVDPRIRVR